jgi:hypothetical protein
LKKIWQIMGFICGKRLKPAPEATIRMWIKKGTLKAYPVVRAYIRSHINLIDIKSLAEHIGENPETIMKKLHKAGASIFVRAVVD